MALFSPILNVRNTYAQESAKRLFCFVDAGTPYVQEVDIFPEQRGRLGRLPHNLEGFDGLQDDMVVVNGCSFDQDPEPIKGRGNWHVSSVGQCLTASNPRKVGGSNGSPTGASVDHIVARALGKRSHVANVSNKDRKHMRNRPFARENNGRVDFNLPHITPFDAWSNVFGSYEPETADGAAIARLRADKSILDVTLDDLNRFQRQLTGVERVKLDVHLDAIRKAEQGIQQDLASQEEVAVQCAALEAPRGRGDNNGGAVDVSLVGQRSSTHFDIMFAGFACQLIGVGGLMLGYSGEDDEYNYNWVDGINFRGDFHGDVWHKGSSQRNLNKLAAQWQWGEYAKFCHRLKQTPEGTGSMLDNSVCYGTGIFGKHHRTTRVPAVFVGNAQGALETGRYIRMNNTKLHCQALTSVANLMDVPISGIGDHPNCGPLDELGHS